MRLRPLVGAGAVSIYIGLLRAEAVGASFVLYVGESSNSTVQQISQAGTVSLYANVPSTPLSLAFNESGNLFVGCENIPGIAKVTAGHPVATGFGSAPAYIPGLAFDPSGDLYVSEQQEQKVGCFNASGTAITTSISPTVSSPSGMAFDTSGDLFIADLQNNDVIEVTPAGVQSVFASVVEPLDVVFDSSGNLYVSSIASQPGTGSIDKFTPGGNESIFANTATAPGGVFEPNSMAFGPDGNLYVVNMNTIDQITPVGVDTIFSNKINGPTGIAFVPTASVPEPAAVTLLFAGGLVLLKRRRQGVCVTKNLSRCRGDGS